MLDVTFAKKQLELQESSFSPAKVSMTRLEGSSHLVDKAHSSHISVQYGV